MNATMITFALLIMFPCIATASTAGNPDQRPSLLLGVGYDWGDVNQYHASETYRFEYKTEVSLVGSFDSAWRRFFGAVTLPTSRSLSLLLSVAHSDQLESRLVRPDQFYTTTSFFSANFALRIYLP